MAQRSRVTDRTWGVLSIIVGAFMVEGGVMEVIAFWPQGQTPNIVVGAIGAAASAVLLVSGAAFCTGQPFGRKSAITGAIGMAPVHLVGWILGFVGVPGAVMGVAYPTLLLLVLRGKPDLGAPIHTAAGLTKLPPTTDNIRRRASLSAA